MTPKNAQQIELLAPAGSFGALAAALRAGADAVYFGVGRLNMRARAAANFEVEDMEEIVRKCRTGNVRCYLVLNTIVYDGEMQESRTICDRALAAGVDAVVASDVAIIQYAHAIGLEVHISVQCNVCNLESVRFYSQFADVMVLARELTLPQVKSIAEEIHRQQIKGPSGQLVRIEVFAHGALCVSVSGKCYMSLGVYNASANRGACYQNCRRKYRVIDEQTGEELVIDNQYVMSPKDICTVNVMDQLLDAGISVFKLEGRGRGPDYVDVVTRTYRDAIDSSIDGTFSREKVDVWLEQLKSVFNRGFWLGGYYLGDKLGEWCGVDGSLAPMRKVEVGRVTKYFSKIGVGEFEILTDMPLFVGDQIVVEGRTTGAVQIEVTELRVGDGSSVQSAERGQTVSFVVPRKVRMNDRLYKYIPRKLGDGY